MTLGLKLLDECRPAWRVAHPFDHLAGRTHGTIPDSERVGRLGGLQDAPADCVGNWQKLHKRGLPVIPGSGAGCATFRGEERDAILVDHRTEPHLIDEFRKRPIRRAALPAEAADET